MCSPWRLCAGSRLQKQFRWEKNKTKPDTFVVTVTGWATWKKMWASPRVVKISVWVDESLWRVHRRNENKSIEEEIWCICLTLRAIRFRAGSGGALSLAFGQFMIIYRSHWGQKQNIKPIWKSISAWNSHSNSVVICQIRWSVAALVFCSTSVCIMWDYSPLTWLSGMYIELKIKGTIHKPV